MLVALGRLTLQATKHVAVANRLQHLFGFLLRHLAILRGIERGHFLFVFFVILRFLLTSRGQLSLGWRFALLIAGLVGRTRRLLLARLCAIGLSWSLLLRIAAIADCVLVFGVAV